MRGIILTTLKELTVMFGRRKAGTLSRDLTGYHFSYDTEYIKTGSPISASLPFQNETFHSDFLFPFFQGLLPEGWYNDIVCRKMKLDKEDWFGILASSCSDCIGAVWIRKEA
jgi:serine/threonine-protein kinase HipA